MNAQERFANILRVRREELHMDQKGYADYLGLGSRTISRWECCHQAPRLDFAHLVLFEAGRSLIVGPEDAEVETEQWGLVAQNRRRAAGRTVRSFPGIDKDQWARWVHGTCPLLSTAEEVCYALNFRYQIGGAV